MSGSRTDLKNIAPPLTEARLSRQYDEIRSRMPSPPRSARRRAWAERGGWAVAACATAALAAVAVQAGRSKTNGLVDDAVIESGSIAGGARGAAVTAVTLADGSRVELGADTRARLTSAHPKAIRIDIERGSLEIEATHVDGRTFVVGAGTYDVHVVGTHFEVRRDPGDAVTVRVDRGVVEVTSMSRETRRLAAGEQWSAPDGSQQPSTAVAPEPPPSAAANAPDSAGNAFTQGIAPPPSASGAVARQGEGARELFDDAQRARADGRSLDAAHAFDRLRRTFPHDPRAALAAFELGRLRLDVLGDPRGAEEALRDAIALGPSSPFREDAEARRVEALGRAGDANGCAVARAAYLARWPNGTYRRAVELGCGDR